jgi:arsenical pump membrane protein
VHELDFFTAAIVALAITGVIFRPFGLHEAIPAVAGAVLLVAAGLLPARAALAGIAQGTDVYLFLTGMMLLAELARAEGLFDWLAAHTARRAGGSASKLFTLIYLMGTLVTVFLSNDATAVVLTPAVAAVTRAAGAKKPLPYLLICAFVANAASFVLPISNPANLVIYGSHMPPLLAWLRQYALASCLSVGATFLLLRLTQRAALRQAVTAPPAPPNLSAGGRFAGFGILATAILLLLASAFGLPLGLPTAIAGAATLVLVTARGAAPWPILKNISWSTLALVAGLFVMVAALDRLGLAAWLASCLRAGSQLAPSAAIGVTGLLLGLATNLTNNLPAGLIAGHAIQTAQASPRLTGAALIGVDLGPNLSVTGSLATILWLQALRREHVDMSAPRFLKLGTLVMPPALLLTICGLLIAG